MGICMGCGRLLHRERVEITQIQDEHPRYIDGRWQGCCGALVAETVSCVHSMEGPSVPTPEDILRGAGLL